MFKTLKALAIAGAIALFAAPVSANDIKELNVSYVTSPFNLQVIVTKRHELLEKEFAQDNIQINWHKITSGAKQAQAMAAGSLDFGMVMNSSSVLISNAMGNPIQFVAGVSRPSDTFALVSKDESIQSFADLKGKTVAGPKGTVLHQLLVAGLVGEGLTVDDVNFVSMGIPKAQTAMLAGQIDGALLAASSVITSEQQGAHIVATSRGLAVPKLGMTAPTKFVEAHPDIVERVVNVHRDAMAWIEANPEEAIALGAEEAGISIADAKRLAAWADFTTTFGEEDLESLSDDMAFLIANEMMREEIDIKSVFASTALAHSE